MRLSVFIFLLFIICIGAYYYYCTVGSRSEDYRRARDPNSFIPTECISVERCKQRRIDLLQHMENVNFIPFNFNFFKATTPDSVEKKYSVYKIALKDTRLSCWLSHLRLWKKYKDHPTPVLVIEDDVRFEPDFAAKLNKVVKALENVDDWDVCMLGRVDLEKHQNIPLHTCDLEVIKNDFIQTHCYLFNPKRDQLLRYCDPVYMDMDGVVAEFETGYSQLAIDTYLSHLNKKGKLTALGVKTPLANQISSSDMYGSTTN